VVRVVFAAASILLPSVAAAQTTPPPREPLECKGALQDLGRQGQHETLTGQRQISGRVIIQCDGTQLFADEINWDDTTAWAKGDVLVIQEGLRVNAERAGNGSPHQARYIFYGQRHRASHRAEASRRACSARWNLTSRLRRQESRRLGPKTYRLTEGWFTTCMQTPPRWEIVGSQGTIHAR
jgi:lipopolysaccharide assembly outer membrane protein LptD (OstA)